MHAFESATILGMWSERCRRSASQVFITAVEREEPASPTAILTYGDVDAEARKVSQVLTSAGVGSGDRVVLHLSNGPSFVVAFLACQLIGAVAVPTIVGSTSRELAYVASHSQALVIVDEEPVQAVVDGVHFQHGLTVISSEDWSTRLDVSQGSSPRASVNDRLASPSRGSDICMMLYTSGTTSSPKGVMISNRAAVAVAQENAAAVCLSAVDRHLCVLPLFHVNALFFQIFPAIWVGCSVVLTNGFSARNYMDALISQACTIGNLTNGPLRLLLRQGEDTLENTTLRLMMYALPLEEDEITSLQNGLSCEFSMGWGLTETLASGTRTPSCLPPKHGWQSIGMVSAGWDLIVVDDDNQPVDHDNVGELLVRGPGLMSGYFRNKADTEAAFVNGYFKTGDLGRLDADGYVFFVDRKKDVIKVKGENVSTGEVEQVLRSDLEVVDAAVVGINDAVWGEKPVAFVEMAPGKEMDVDALTALCVRQLSPFKRPTEFVAVVDFPRTSVGKIRKTELVQLYLKGSARA